LASSRQSHEKCHEGLWILPGFNHRRQQITGYAMMKGWAVAEFFIEAAFKL
jgi:hypothetical protein